MRRKARSLPAASDPPQPWAEPDGPCAINGLFQKVRNVEAVARQREALVSLGTLSAGIAHEINTGGGGDPCRRRPGRGEPGPAVLTPTSTLVMLGHKRRDGVSVVRDYGDDV